MTSCDRKFDNGKLTLSRRGCWGNSGEEKLDIKVTQDINLFKKAFNACGEMIILVSGVLIFLYL